MKDREEEHMELVVIDGEMYIRKIDLLRCLYRLAKGQGDIENFIKQVSTMELEKK